jgi:hypothetical protein
MLKKLFVGLILITALVLCGGTLFAQEKAAAPAGPEKVMIFNGESLKVQLDGDIRLNLIQNQYNVVNDCYQLFVNNQKWGWSTGITVPYAGAVSMWFPWQAAIKQGGLFFDVRQSKFGITITGPGVAGGYSFGRLEIDFNGGFGALQGNVVRQPVPRLRNVFAGLGWKKDMFQAKVTFGQYTSLMVPYLAYPVSLAFYPWFEKGLLFDWDQGMMVSFVFGDAKYSLLIDADIARAKAGDDAGAGLYPGVRSPAIAFGQDERGNGEASMAPAWHGRIGFTMNPDPLFSMTIAVQGHYYKERTQVGFANLALYGVPAAYIGLLNSWSRTNDIASKSLGAQAKIMVSVVGIQGAGWIGENMDNFTAGFFQGWRESLSGLKNLADKGRGGYAQVFVALQKIGIPIMFFVGMGQEVKSNNSRIPYSTPLSIFGALGVPAPGTYPVTVLGGFTTAAATFSTILSNSEVSGGLWVFLSQYMKAGFECGEMVTKYKKVNGTSASMVYRATLSYTF